MFTKEEFLTGISDGFDLVDVIVVNDVVKCRVELVEEVNHLVWSAAAGQLGEAHDVAAHNIASEPVLPRNLTVESFRVKSLIY